MSRGLKKIENKRQKINLELKETIRVLLKTYLLDQTYLRLGGMNAQG
jgi:hypothetical protein